MLMIRVGAFPCNTVVADIIHAINDDDDDDDDAA